MSATSVHDGCTARVSVDTVKCRRLADDSDPAGGEAAELSHLSTRMSWEGVDS
jgi:hypothetical protein